MYNGSSVPEFKAMRYLKNKVLICGLIDTCDAGARDVFLLVLFHSPLRVCDVYAVGKTMFLSSTLNDSLARKRAPHFFRQLILRSKFSYSLSLSRNVLQGRVEV